MTLEAEVEHLRTENAKLRLYAAQLQEQLAAAVARIAELEQPPDLPPFVKPNRQLSTEPTRKRKKRAIHHNHGRRCEPPTRFQTHALDHCPDCNRQLSGESIDYRRQVIELPPPVPVEIVEHQVIKRWCPHCRCWRSPQLDLTGQVFGQGRIGTDIAGLVAFLSRVLRLPMRRIQAYLRLVHQLTISTGEVVELLHAVRRALQSQVDTLTTQARASPILHADRTSWRENGQNGYIWSFSTPGEDAVRDYEYDHSRGQAVVKRILDGKFTGHLVSDFDCG